MLRRIKKIALWSLLAVIVWAGVLGTLIWSYGSNDEAAKSDCIIVLGAAVQGDEPSPVFKERIPHGIDLYQKGFAPKLLFTGGFGDGQHLSESAVARSLAIAQAVPSGDILVEERSRTTQQNLSEAWALMQQHGLKSAIIVSDPLHMKRSVVIAEDIGMRAVPSPTPTTRYRSLQTKLAFLIREVFFFQHYLIRGC